MDLSYVIVSHNRRQALLRTLGVLERTTPIQRNRWTCWVVDNASNDGTHDAVTTGFPRVKLLRRRRNEGVSARNHGIEAAQSRYVTLLDDDSYPDPNATERSIRYLDSHPETAAVVGRIVLPNGHLEACALPGVLLSGAVCIRKSVLNEVGGFRREFFRKAGEYDLSFRIWQAGHRIQRFEDIVYRHDKVTTGRSSALAHRMDLRNNLILVERYLTADLRPIYRADFTARYTAIARDAGQGGAARRGRWEARLWALRQRLTGRQTLNAAATETIFELETQAHRVGQWVVDHDVRRVVIADFSKNMYATYRACRKASVQIAAVADNAPAFHDMQYRGIPIVPDRDALRHQPDGVVLSNINPAQVDRRLAELRQQYPGPILRLWHPQYAEGPTVAQAIRPQQPATQYHKMGVI